MTNLEVEVKFFLHNTDDIREKVKKAGLVFEKTEKENNIRFEDDNLSLLKKGSLLRLRKTLSHNLLTFKGKVDSPDSDCKVFNETEVMVSNFDDMIALLGFIGFRQVQSYEKVRETYRNEKVLLCLDTMPYGCFMEIEGDAADIRDTAEMLGFEWKDRILANYLAIFERLKEKFNLNFNDVTFENFKDATIDFESCHDLFIEK